VLINYPQRAYETFKRLTPVPEFREIYQFLQRILSRVSSPLDRARKTHKYVDLYTNEVLANPAAKRFLTCHKGCTACCHTQVSVNSDEAELLAHKVIHDGVEVDLKKLYIQGNVENNPRKWFELPYEMRGCVFLGEEGQCRVYEDRPSVCRTNNALSSPSQCDTRDGIEKPVRLLNTEKADFAVIASYEAAGEAGALPHMLWKALGKVSEPRPKVVSKKVVKKAYLKRVKKDLSKIFEV
jgi:Fe-S-cluster containining protein